MVLVKSVEVDLSVRNAEATKAKISEIDAKAEHLKRVFGDGFALKIDKAAASEKLRLFRTELAEATKDRTATVKVKVDDSALAKLAGKMKAGGGPGWLGPALMLAPAAASLGGVAAGAGIGLAGAFTAGAGALAAFGAVAKPVLTSAKTAADAVTKAQDTYNAAIAAGVPKAQAQATLQKANASAQLTYNAALAGGANPAKALAAYHQALARNQLAYNSATNAGTFGAKAYAAQQAAIGKAYAGLSPQQIALSKQLGAMADAWQKVKAAQTPVVAGAMQPWLKSVTDLTKNLAPIIAKVSPAIREIGTLFDTLVNSSAFTTFRDFIAGTGSATVRAGGNLLTGFLDAVITLLPKFNPLIQAANRWVYGLGDSIARWANSQKTADRITAFMAWFSRNGPVVGQLLKNIAAALKAMTPGLTSGGMLELQALSGFFGLVAKLPPSIAKPLFEVAGALLLLNKLGVVSVGLKLIGMDAAKAAAGGGAVGMWGKMLPGVRLVGGTLAAVVVVDMILKSTPNKGDTGVPGQQGNWFETPFNMPGPKSPKSAGNWLTSFAPYERALKDFGKFVVNEWNTIWSNTVSGAVQDWKRLTGVWDRGRHYLAGSFDQTRHQIAGTADGLGRYLTGSFGKTRHDIAAIWDQTWNNTVGRAGRGVHDVAGWVDAMRHGTAVRFDGIRHDASAIWDSTWNNTISRAGRGVRDVAAWLGSMRHSIANIFGGIRGDIASAWNTIWANTVSRVAGGVGTVVNWFRGLPGKVTGALASLGFSLYGIGARALSLLLAGARSAVGGITSFFSSFAHGIVSVFKKIWGWFSPSAVMYEGGKSLMQGLAGGIKDHAHLAQAQAAKAAKMAAFSAAGPAWMATGGVMRWDPMVKQVLAMEGLGAQLASQVEYQIMTESGGNPNAINLCLTLDAVILTRRGLIKHDDVRPGDETIGYNFATGRNEWTRITAVHHYEDAPLIRLGNSRWHATTTPQHKWVNLPRITAPAAPAADSCHLCKWPSGTRRRGVTTEGGLRIHLAKAHGIRGLGQHSAYATEPQWVTTEDVRSRDRLLLSAAADTGPGLDITEQEAAILGWIAGDGHIEKFAGTPRGRNKPTISIAQSKPAMVAKLEALLADVPCAHYAYDAPPSRVNRKLGAIRHTWRLDHAYAQDLLRRAGNPKEQAVTQILGMSAAQRRAWLDAFIDAEGHRDGEYVMVTQAHGPLLEAAHLAIYLCGYRPRLEENTRENPAWSPTARISAGRPVISGSFLKREDAGRGPVWCVSTELGSWTAEQDGQIFLTGNSDINAQHGDPSRGLLQTIMATFKAFHWPGTSWNIFDPLANIAAAVNYARHTYGPTLMSGGMGMGSGHGYWTGTGSASPGWAWVGERGPELVKFRGGEQVAPAYSGGRGGGAPVIYNINVNVPPGANMAEAGRATVAAIKQFERGAGAGWRNGRDIVTGAKIQGIV